MKTKKLRFAPLVRVSTEQQDEEIKTSMESQRNNILQVVTNRGGIIPTECWQYTGQEHSTRAYRLSNPDYERTIFKRLLDDCDKDIFDAIIVDDESRWGRDLMDSLEGFDILKRNNIMYFVGDMGYDLRKPDHESAVRRGSLESDAFVKKMCTNSIRGRIAAAKKGIPSSGRLPYGRTYDKKTNEWGLDEKKVHLIQGATERYLKGESLEKLAKEMGMVATTLHTILLHRCGEDWKLKFEYKENYIKEEVMLKIPRIFSEQTIKAIHAQNKSNKTSENFGRGHRKYLYLLSGFIFCENCGHRFTTATNQQRNFYYRHRTTDGNKDCTYKRFVPARELESKILISLIEVLGNRKKIEEAIKRSTPDLGKIERLQSEQFKLENKIKEIHKSKERLVKAVAEGNLSSEDVGKQMTGLQKDEKILSERFTKVQTELSYLPDPEQIKKTTNWSIKIMSHITKNPSQILKMTFEEQRELVEFAFRGFDSQGKHLGIYVSDNEKGEIQYRMNANFESTLQSATLTDADIAVAFKLDPDYQDTRKEIDKIREELSHNLSNNQSSISSCKLEHHQGSR